MTDITELAQRMKAAAVRAKTATEEYASGHMSVSVCFAECEEFNRLTDGPDNILALVEALEKAQQKIQAHERAELTWMNALELPDDATRNDILPAIHAEKYTLRAANKRIAELEESHAQVIQSRDHYIRISEEGLKQLAESRTVTVKLPPRVDSSNVPFSAHTWNCCLAEVEKRLTADGIKWEAE